MINFKTEITCELDNFYFHRPVYNAFFIVLFQCHCLVFLMDITPASPDIKIMHSYNI